MHAWLRALFRRGYKIRSNSQPWSSELSEITELTLSVPNVRAADQYEGSKSRTNGQHLFDIFCGNISNLSKGNDVIANVRQSSMASCYQRKRKIPNTCNTIQIRE